MNKLTYSILPAVDAEFYSVIKDHVLYTTLWMNGQPIMSDHNHYASRYSAKRGLNRICKLLAKDVKVVDIRLN